MLKRMRSALVAVCALAAAATLPTSRSEAHPGHSGGGTSRSCLTGEARNLLSRIEARFGPMQIVSTCRPGARTPSGRPSLHGSGRAIDFNAGSRKAEVVQWLMANHSGGLMTYPGMSHIHVDVGQRFVSLSGQRVAVGYGRGYGGGGRSYRRTASYRTAGVRHVRSGKRYARYTRYARYENAPRSDRSFTSTSRRGVRYARYE